MASRQSLGELQKKKDEKSRQLISTVWENRKSITWDEARIISSAEVDVAFVADPSVALSFDTCVSGITIPGRLRFRFLQHGDEDAGTK